MRAIVDLDSFQIIRTEDKRVLVGECNRCGECCKGPNVPFPHPPLPPYDRCKQLVQDQVNDQGEPIFRCDCYAVRPVGCALWPISEVESPVECGFHYEPAEK